MTFKAVAELYLAAHEKTWRNEQHKWQWRQTLEAHAYKVFGDWPVQTVTTGAVMKVIEPIWHKLPETAARVRGRIETVLRLCCGARVAHWRQSGSLARPYRQPAAGAHQGGEGLRTMPLCPGTEIGAFMAAVEAERGTAAMALRFTILTAARTTEALEARWAGD